MFWEHCSKKNVTLTVEVLRRVLLKQKSSGKYDLWGKAGKEKPEQGLGMYVLTYIKSNCKKKKKVFHCIHDAVLCFNISLGAAVGKTTGRAVENLRLLCRKAVKSPFFKKKKVDKVVGIAYLGSWSRERH